MDGVGVESHLRRVHWKSDYLTGRPDAAIDVLTEHLATITSPLSDFKIVHLGGAAARQPDDSALSHRELPWLLNINPAGAGPGPRPHLAWTRSLYEAMQPSSAGRGCVNFLMYEGQDRVRAVYGPGKYERLVEIKRRYDPTTSTA